MRNYYWKRSILCVIFLFLFSPAIYGQEQRLLPVDEGNKDRSLLMFRNKLIDAAKRKDRKYILTILDPKIINSLGGEGGIEEFKQHWNLDSPDSKLWNELITALSLGGTFTNEKRQEFCAPYTFTRFPDDLDAFEYSAIIDKDVEVHAKPDQNAPIVGKLSYSLVKADYSKSVHDKADEESFSWVNIVTPDGKEGYVAGKQIRSPIDYRICFKRRRGRWIITTFVAGD